MSRVLTAIGSFRRNPEYVQYTPLITTALLEYANVGQLYRMWTTWTAAGQELTSWIAVNIALVLWLNFYFVITPDKKWAIRGTLFGICLNFLVICSVYFFRSIGRG